MKDKVLIVEDDKRISRLLTTVLKANNYETEVAETQQGALSLISSQCPDLVLLDLGLPDNDGTEIIRFVRSYSSMPIIVVSARSTEKDKVEALDLGADDYVSKPFGTSELLARIRTALRHNRTVDPGSAQPMEISVLGGRLMINYETHRIIVDGHEVSLTQIEYRIVSLLGRHAGRVLTYDHIMREIWGPYQKDDNKILRVNMAHIRRKMEKNPATPEFIFTETGVGYRMADRDEK